MSVAELLEDDDWWPHAACYGADQTPFFPDCSPSFDYPIPTEAQAACVGCPVRDLCLAYALANTVEGIWAGTNEIQRRRLRRKRGLRSRPLYDSALLQHTRITRDQIDQQIAAQRGDAPMPETSTAPTVIWEEPPPIRRGVTSKLPVAEFAKILAGRPGAWARIWTFDKKTSAASVVSRHKKDGIPELPTGRFELAARTTSSGSALYGRCTDLGEADGDKAA